MDGSNGSNNAINNVVLGAVSESLIIPDYGPTIKQVWELPHQAIFNSHAPHAFPKALRIDWASDLQETKPLLDSWVGDWSPNH